MTLEAKIRLGYTVLFVLVVVGTIVYQLRKEKR